jgi:putative Ca2+/H+ antiporter (TMEM165/GDT1 family)
MRFWSAGVVALVELGDKTRLLACYGAYRRKRRAASRRRFSR